MSDAVRFAVAAILFTAAVLKTHQLATEPVLGIGLLESRRFFFGVVQYELLLAFWLGSGLAVRSAWCLTLASFVLFAAATCQAIARDAARDGLGWGLTGPWCVLSLDLLVLLAMCRFPPRFPLISTEVSGGHPRRSTTPAHDAVSFGQNATRHAWLFGAWLTTAVLVGAVGQPTRANDPREVWPSPSERHRELDFLLREARGTAHVTFPLRNTSKRTMHVLDVVRSCGCTRTQLEKHELAPGECSQLTVSIDVSTQEHQRTVSCTVITDDESEPRKVFVASVRPTRPAQFDSQALDFGEVAPGMRTSRVITLRTVAVDGSAPGRVLDVKGSNSSLVCRVLSDHVTSGTGVPLATREVKVRVDFLPPMECPFDGLTICARTDTSVQSTVLELPVYWRLKEIFSVSPPRLLFSLPAQSTDAYRRNVVVKRRDGQPFQIRGVHGTTSATIVKFRSASEVENAAIEIEFMPERVSEKRYTCAVVVETDCALQRIIVVPVAAMVNGGDVTAGKL